MIRLGLVPPGGPARLRRLTALLIAATVVAGCSPVRTVEAVRLLSGLAGDPQEQVAEAERRRVEIAYEVEDRPRRGDVYLPDGTARAALVVVPGAAEEGRRDPRLIAFAGGLTRAGFLVLVPQLAGDDQLQISADDAVAIADGVRHLTAAAEVPEVGLAALSYAVGPTVLAALHEDTRPRVRYILAIGGYYDIVAGITYITTGAFRADPGEPWRHGEIEHGAKWIFLRANADRLADPADVRLLTEMAERRVRDPGADVADLAARLGDDGRAVYRLFVNADPDRVPELIAALPAAFRGQIEALDLARHDLGRLDADLILIHGRNDPMVPHTESLRLAGAVPPGRANVYLLDDLRHVDLGTPATGDAWTMMWAAYRLLEARDAAPAPAALMPVAVAWREAGRVRVATGGGRRPVRGRTSSGSGRSPHGAGVSRAAVTRRDRRGDAWHVFFEVMDRMTSNPLRSPVPSLPILALAAALVGCAQPGPVLYPNAQLDAVGREQAERDIAECRQLAEAAGARPAAGAGETAARGAVGGGALGGATGAVGGAVVGRAGSGAAVGAASGATAGLLRGLFGGGGPSPAYRQVVDRCLAERGYEPVGWE